MTEREKLLEELSKILGQLPQAALKLVEAYAEYLQTEELKKN